MAGGYLSCQHKALILYLWRVYACGVGFESGCKKGNRNRFSLIGLISWPEFMLCQVWLCTKISCVSLLLFFICLYHFWIKFHEMLGGKKDINTCVTCLNYTSKCLSGHEFLLLNFFVFEIVACKTPSFHPHWNKHVYKSINMNQERLL